MNQRDHDSEKGADSGVPVAEVGRSIESGSLPEEQKISAGASSRWALTRRDFVKTFTGGLAVLWLMDWEARAQAESGNAGRNRDPRPKPLAAWLQIAPDGTVTVFTGKTEVGQNIRTSLTQAVAEELPTPMARIKLVMADTALVPWDAGTFGSLSTPVMNLQFRRVAATAREALLDLAATQWNVARSSLVAEDGSIRHPATSRSIGFGELTRGGPWVLDVSDDIALKPASAWTIAGTSVPKIDGRNFVTGRHKYTVDTVSAAAVARAGGGLPEDSVRTGLLHGKVLRAPSWGATLVTLEAGAARRMAGVTVVRDGDFVGVTAATEQEATQALAALRAEWKTTPQISERELFAHLRATGEGAPKVDAAAATVTAGGAVVKGELRQTYTLDYIAHVPLEPRAAVAEWMGDALTVWTGSQRPFGVRTELATAFRMPEEKVRVLVPDTGSGYGGKHTGEAAVEAARLAKGSGQPVKLVWTRAEEFTWAYVRPAGIMDLESKVEADGRISRWSHRNYNSGNGGIRSVYDVPGAVTAFHRSDSPLRQGSYRALASVANHFAREVHIDELARSIEMDAREFRLKNLRDARARAALEAATAAFGWGEGARAAGSGVGLAIGFDKGGYLATCAEVAVDRTTGKVVVKRLVQSFECGAIVNPEHLRDQVEGCIVQGLGGALFESIRFENGRILNASLATYRVPRFSDMPRIEVVLLDRKDLPSAGAGEAPIACVAPAIANAIFDAAGVRLRSLPLLPHGGLGGAS